MVRVCLKEAVLPGRTASAPWALSGHNTGLFFSDWNSFVRHRQTMSSCRYHDVRSENASPSCSKRPIFVIKFEELVVTSTPLLSGSQHKGHTRFLHWHWMLALDLNREVCGIVQYGCNLDIIYRDTGLLQLVFEMHVELQLWYKVGKWILKANFSSWPFKSFHSSAKSFK